MFLGFINLLFVKNLPFVSSYSFKQLLWIFISLIIFFIISRFRLQTIKSLSIPFYLFTLILLVYVLFFGDRISGAKSWIRIGNFLSLQPSELVKISFVFVIAKFFSDLGAYSKSLLVKYSLGLFFFLIPFFLIIFQPDLGSAIMLLIISFSIVFSFSFNKKVLTVLIILISFSSVPIWNYGLKEYQKQRIVSFLEPEKDPSGYGYNVIQSKVAVGSGKFLGKGLGNSSQGKLKFLPEKHTDFAFSVWAEQTGFIGSLLLIGLYSFIVFYSLSFLSKIKDTFLQVMIFGLSSYLFFHLIINISMTLGLFPVIGIPLIMFSYGGSSLMSGAIAISLISLILSDYKDHNRMGL